MTPSQLSYDEVAAALEANCGVVERASDALGVSPDSLRHAIKYQAKYRPLLEKWDKNPDRHRAVVAARAAGHGKHYDDRGSERLSTGQYCRRCEMRLDGGTPGNARLAVPQGHDGLCGWCLLDGAGIRYHEPVTMVAVAQGRGILQRG